MVSPPTNSAATGNSHKSWLYCLNKNTETSYPPLSVQMPICMYICVWPFGLFYFSLLSAPAEDDDAALLLKLLLLLVRCCYRCWRCSCCCWSCFTIFAAMVPGFDPDNLHRYVYVQCITHWYNAQSHVHGFYSLERLTVFKVYSVPLIYLLILTFTVQVYVANLLWRQEVRVKHGYPIGQITEQVSCFSVLKSTNQPRYLKWLIEEALDLQRCNPIRLVTYSKANVLYRLTGILNA